MGLQLDKCQAAVSLNTAKFSEVVLVNVALCEV